MADDQIIAKIRNGGQAELAVIYEEYRAEFIHWIIREYHCSMDDSKDIYQLTILIFYDNVRSGKTSPAKIFEKQNATRPSTRKNG